MLTMLRMTRDVSLMEYIRTEFDVLHSRIEASETRINKELCDKTVFLSDHNKIHAVYY